MATENKSTLDSFLGFASDLATPFAQSFAYGLGQKSKESDFARGVNYYDSLNGSGAPDRRGYARTPKSPEEIVSNNPFSGIFSGGKGGSGLLVAIVAVVVGGFILKKFLK